MNQYYCAVYEMEQQRMLNVNMLYATRSYSNMSM